MPIIQQFSPVAGMSTSNNEENALDRLSDLPDMLLRKIMFYLTAQEAQHEKFLDNLLLHCRPVALDARWVSATCNQSDDSLDYSDIHPWIRHALRSNAWALGIMEHSGTNLLSIDGYPFPFTSIHLCILHLCHFSIDDSSVKKLSSGCPVLEDLELKSCAINVTMFSNTTLKSLLINSTQNTEHLPNQFEHLVIDMPNLVILHLDEIPKRTIQFVDVSLVNKAGTPASGCKQSWNRTPPPSH
uniref:F-box domain-containing protein n=1 Tax=Leersia perrieri TaxID=77586 RepID=A0A0D9X4C4_9ORYZ